MFRHDNVSLYNIYLTRNLDNLSLFCSALCMTQKYLFEKFQLMKMWRKKMNNSCIWIYRINVLYLVPFSFQMLNTSKCNVVLVFVLFTFNLFFVEKGLKPFHSMHSIHFLFNFLQNCLPFIITFTPLLFCASFPSSVCKY